MSRPLRRSRCPESGRSYGARCPTFGRGGLEVTGRFEIRRDEDDELCGFVAERDGVWWALTVFGAGLGDFPDRARAETIVREQGLASLAEHWEFRRDPDDDWQICCILEAGPHGAVLALDYFSMPGVPVVRVSADELSRGAELRRARD